MGTFCNQFFYRYIKTDKYAGCSIYLGGGTSTPLFATIACPRLGIYDTNIRAIIELFFPWVNNNYKNPAAYLQMVFESFKCYFRANSAKEQHAGRVRLSESEDSNSMECFHLGTGLAAWQNFASFQLKLEN